jgi:NAD(P)H-dependent flavin oxidoreductase YrpB (nitropropane dioxygenase family)
MIAAAGMGAGAVAARTAAAMEAAGPDARIGVGFLVPFLDDAALASAASVASVIELFYGDPVAAPVRRAQDSGALVAWQVGSLDEALAAADVGCDLVVVQGREAGGHVRGTVELLPLLRAVRTRLDLPLVASGGIGSGAAVAAALGAGADAVRIGTRLVATLESDAHPAYVDALIAASARDTVITEAFAQGWPDAPHRVLRSCVASDVDPALRSPSPPTRTSTGDVASAALYAGESVTDVTTIKSAATVIDELVRDAGAAMSRAVSEREG